MDTVLKILQSAALFGAQTPAFLSLLEVVKEPLSDDDVASLEARMKTLDAAADDQHNAAQEKDA